MHTTPRGTRNKGNNIITMPYHSHNIQCLHVRMLSKINDDSVTVDLLHTYIYLFLARTIEVLKKPYKMASGRKT